jgi:hypothetical protein
MPVCHFGTIFPGAGREEIRTCPYRAAAACATPCGYSPGAYAGYDRGFDNGYQGYGGYNTNYGGGSYRPYGNGYSNNYDESGY